MARPKKNDAPDLTIAHDLTSGVIERLQCPPDKPQAFLRDSKSPSLRVRVTPPSKKNPEGVKAFVFEAKLKRETLRLTLGDVRSWTIEDARIEANRLRVLVDKGTDPRELERQKEAAAAALQATAVAQAVTVGDAWAIYVAERRAYWGVRHYENHLEMTRPGGEARKRAKGPKTLPGPIAPLLPLRLVDLNGDAVHAWAKQESKTRPASVRLGLRLLKAFLRWCSNEAQYAQYVNPAAASSKKAREAAGSPEVRNDYLQREQLSAWFTHVRQLQNPVVAAYLQCLLITGARRDEMASLRWEDINFQWHGMTLKDKIEGTRQVPLTPFVEHLISALPRRNEWVFSSVRVLDCVFRRT